MLSHRAISQESDGFYNIYKLDSTDHLLTVLPFFHAFGYTIEIWVPMLLGSRAVYHYTPLEPKVIGELSRKYECNFFITTATFGRTYMRKCPRDNFEKLETVIG